MAKAAVKQATSSRRTSPSATRIRSVRSAKERIKEYVPPMLAQIGDQPFDDPEWIFEIKWDGYRAVAEVKNGTVKLYSRNGLSFEKLYPKITEALASLDDCILDGEIVVINEHNRPDFQKLQQYDLNPSLPIAFYAFDCLSVGSKWITHLRLLERKEQLPKLIKSNNRFIKISDHVVGDGIALFEQIMKKDLEGMIAKRAQSIYTPGKRSKDWLKIKNHNTQEAIIVGYTEPKGSRPYFGALVLAIQEGRNFRYVGHTGTGFTHLGLKDLYEKLQPLKIDKSPFDHKIPMQGRITWVKPKLVGAIKYTELTADGILRHPVFMGLRIDKSARETNTIDLAAKKSKNIKSKKRTL